MNHCLFKPWFAGITLLQSVAAVALADVPTAYFMVAKSHQVPAGALLMRSLIGVLCVLLCLNVNSEEALTVIYDSGDTLPLEPYLPKRVSKEKTATQMAKRQLPFNLPITTPSMQSGEVTTSPKALRYLQRPLFLVGTDQLSRDWLAEKRQQLIRLGAVGLLVEAKNVQEIEAVLTLAEGLRVVPASAEGFATELGLSHYPILLSKEGWEQ